METDPDKLVGQLKLAKNVEATAGPDRGEPRLVPPPSNPMAVARQFVREHHMDGETLLLRAWRGDFFSRAQTCWGEIELRTVRSALYRWLESAAYPKTLPTGEVVLVAFDPNRNKIDNVVDALRAVVHLDGLVEPPTWIDGAGDVLASEVVPVANGLLHVPTRRLLPHSPGFFALHALPFDFDPAATAPTRWLDFLRDLWADEETVSTLQEVVGYLIGGDTRQQKLFLLVGPRRGGKGTIGRVLTALLGRHHVAAPTLSSMATNFGLQPLIGRPLAVISDARLGTKADSSVVVERLLSISGEDSITIDRKYKEPWTGRLPARFLILTNELPRLLDSSGALSSRFVLLVLTKSFLGRENPRLTDELLTEASGILNWALEGLDRLNQRGYFDMPESSREALQQLEDLTSPVAAFLRDRCALDAPLLIAVDDLWTAWKNWCSEENRQPGTRANFGRDLKACAPQVRRGRPRVDGDPRYHYFGIGLSAETLHWSRDHRDHPAPDPSDPRDSPTYSLGAAALGAELPEDPADLARALDAQGLDGFAIVERLNDADYLHPDGPRCRWKLVDVARLLGREAE